MSRVSIVLSIIFWLTPICLMVHLALKRQASPQYKLRLGYIYGGLWAIAWLGFGWLFLQVD